MIFDEFGLPRDSGADDMKDSARFAGMMALFDHPQAIDCANYIVDGKPTRHPMYAKPETKHEMISRDQLICLAAGVRKQHKEFFNFYIASYYKPENGDWLSPSHKDHLRRCAGKSDTFLGRLWFWADILWSCYIDPLAEPNQLISMLVVAGDPYLKFYLKHCKDWKKCIRLYWSGWRRESDFAEFLINKLEAI